MDLNQNSTAPFYIPLFIGIYILSRWIDSQLEQKIVRQMWSTPLKIPDQSRIQQDSNPERGVLARTMNQTHHARFRIQD